MGMMNAVQYYGDLLSAITPTEAGSNTLDLFSLGGASKFSCQAIYDVQTPSAKTFDSGKKATLVNQGITYLANDIGTYGNAITIELVDTGVPSQALEISVLSLAISVNLALDAGVAATLVEQDLTYTADLVGVAGNSITIAYIDDGAAGAETVDVTGSDIVVHMDATPVSGSTATQIKTAIDASAPASALISVAISGTGSNVQSAISATPLASGADPAITTDATTLVAALLAESDVTDLIDVSGSGASPLTAISATPLATGANTEVDLDTSEITIPSHGYTTGFKVQLTTTGTLPAPLQLVTDYFIIKIDANTIQLAADLPDALAGTFIEISDIGSNGAVNTVTGVALVGASVTFQKSNNGVNWIDIQTATSITVNGSVMIEVSNVSYRYLKVVKALTSGQVDLKAIVNLIGDAV